jgi:long-chain acyl-CoA synthetase
LFEEVIRRVNAELPGYEQIKKFVLLDAEFSVASGELTPTLKIRRRVVLERYVETIAALYSSPSSEL